MDEKLHCYGSKSEKWIIDRFEEDNAVLENAATLETIVLAKNELPENARPGDTFVLRNGRWHFDHAETEARYNLIQERFNRIRSKKNL
jgi:hypothetical protein